MAFSSSLISYDAYESLLQDTLMVPVDTVVTTLTTPTTTNKERKQLTRDHYAIDKENQHDVLTDQLCEAQGPFILYMQSKKQQSVVVVPIHVCKKTCFNCYSAHSHYCTDHCDLWRYKDLYICESTGNVHYCTSDACDRLIFNDEVSCSLTHVIHARAYCIAKTRQTEMRSRKSKHTTSKAGAHSNTDGEPDSVGPCQLDIYNVTGEYHLSKSRASDKKEKRDVKLELKTITTTITMIINKVMPLLKEFIPDIIQACHVTWVRIIVACKKHTTVNYTLPYHCIVILYCVFRQGLVLVEPDAYRIIHPNTKCALLSNSNDDIVFASIRKLTEFSFDAITGTGTSNKKRHLFTSSDFSRSETFFLDCCDGLLTRLIEAEDLLIHYLTTRVIPKGHTCTIQRESDSESSSLLLSTMKCIIKKKSLQEIQSKGLFVPDQRKAMKCIHVIAHFEDENNNPVSSTTPLYTVYTNATSSQQQEKEKKETQH